MADAEERAARRIRAAEEKRQAECRALEERAEVRMKRAAAMIVERVEKAGCPL